jgi:hypothetical protein
MWMDTVLKMWMDVFKKCGIILLKMWMDIVLKM